MTCLLCGIGTIMVIENTGIMNSMGSVDMMQLTVHALRGILLGRKQNSRLHILGITTNDQTHDIAEKGDDHHKKGDHDLPVGHEYKEKDGVDQTDEYRAEDR